MAPIVLALDEKGAASLGLGIRLLMGLRWLCRSLAVAVAVGGAFAIAAADAQDRPLPPLVVLLFALGIGILAITESATRPERAVAALDPAGTITLDEMGVRLHQPASSIVASRSAASVVRSVAGVDDRSGGPRFPLRLVLRRSVPAQREESTLLVSVVLWHQPPSLW